jgi:hypothetical protein
VQAESICAQGLALKKAVGKEKITSEIERV